jgi:hypothetical protein
MAKNTRNTKAAAAKAPRAAASVEPTADEEAIAFDRVRTELPEPSAAQTRALRRVFSAQRCQRIGATTKAVEVATEARRALLGSAATVREHGATIRYLPARLRFAMDLVAALESSIERQQSELAKRSFASSRRQRAERDCRAARREIVKAFASVVSADEASERAFGEARAQRSTPDDIAASTKKLAALAKSWIDHRDEDLRELAALQRIDAALVEGATNAAAALERAIDVKSLAGAASVTDDATTNELEGRVLLELGALYSAVEDNRTDTKIPLPRLGKATLRALRKSDEPSAAKPPPAPAE